MARKLAQKSEGIIGYWFARETVLPNGDGRAVVIGETLTVNPPLEMCRRGLHGSEHPFDAFQYAPGPLLYRCRFSGEVMRETGKLCASERTALAVVDLTPKLRVFAREQALSVIHLWDAPAVVRRYLETGEESLRGAAEAASTVPGAAVRDAAGAATRAAQWAAADAGTAADAAWVVHWAAGAVAEAAAEAARAATRATFIRIVEGAFAGHDLP